MTDTRDVLAEFVASAKFTDIDPLAKDRARDTIVDAIGVAVAGSREPLGHKMVHLLESLGDIRESGSLLIGSTKRANAPSAALYNGTLIHALDYDDISHPSKAHITCSVLPAIMAVMPDDQILSDEFLEAYIVGYEVATMIGDVLLRRRRAPGWHTTGVLGPFGAAAAVAKIWGLTVEQTANALGTAASCGAGLHINLGSMTKPLHAGRAAQAGVIAAMLAADGFTSSDDVFDAPMGFFRTYCTVSSEEVAQGTKECIERLGNPWELCTEHGVGLKPYPSCAATHCGIEAGVSVGKQIDIAEIESIYVGMAQVSTDPLVYHRPDQGLQGKFSMEFCVAEGMLTGKVSIDSFTDERVTDPQIRSLIDKMTVVVDDRVRDNQEHGAVVKATLRSGESVESIIEIAKGKPERWFSPSDLRTKFEDCVAGSFGEKNASELYDALMDTNQVSRKRAGDLLTG